LAGLDRGQGKGGGVLAKGVAGGEGEGARKIQWVMANLGVALVGEENRRRVASRGKQDQRREELDGECVLVRKSGGALVQKLQ
jgi:hypothetical protein